MISSSLLDAVMMDPTIASTIHFRPSRTNSAPTSNSTEFKDSTNWLWPIDFRTCTTCLSSPTISRVKITVMAATEVEWSNLIENISNLLPQLISSSLVNWWQHKLESCKQTVKQQQLFLFNFLLFLYRLSLAGNTDLVGPLHC